MTALEKPEAELEVRCLAYELLKDGEREVYSGDVIDAWASNPYPRRTTAATFVLRILSAMESEGELTSRMVPAAEHGESQLLRRYFRRAWRDAG